MALALLIEFGKLKKVEAKYTTSMQDLAESQSASELATINMSIAIANAAKNGDTKSVVALCEVRMRSAYAVYNTLDYLNPIAPKVLQEYSNYVWATVDSNR